MGRRILWVAALALLCTVHVTEGTNPGLKGRVTAKGLDYLGQLGTEYLISHLSNVALPGISGEQSILFLGTFKYSLSGKIQEIQIPHSAVQFIPGIGIQLAITDANVKLSGEWDLSFWLGDSGSVALSLNGASISTSLWVSEDAAGHLTVRSAGCTGNLGTTNLRFSGGASWIYNLFTGVIDKLLQSVTSTYLCPLVNKSIKELNLRLQTAEVSHQINQYVGFDYALVNPLQITRQYIEADVKGEFYSVENPSALPFSPAPFSLPDQTNKHVYVGVSEFLANSASYVYFTSGRLHIDLTDSMLPKDSPIHLNTDNFKTLIPEVAKLYPQLPMMLEISASKQPMLTCLPGVVELEAFTSVQAFAIQTDGKKAPLFQLNLDATLEGKINIDGTKYSGALDLTSFTIALAHSDVGLFQLKSLEQFLTGVLQKVVLPKVNGMLSGVLPIPNIDGLRQMLPTITINQGYVLLEV